VRASGVACVTVDWPFNDIYGIPPEPSSFHRTPLSLWPSLSFGVRNLNTCPPRPNYYCVDP